jgi:sulfatase maturation enzyme AslB (radical SAM superfamily)
MVSNFPSLFYTAKSFHIQNYLLMIKENLASFDNPDTCRGCVLKKQTEIYDLDEAVRNIKFRSVLINFHRFYCNCKCSYCDLWEKKQRPDFPLLSTLKELHTAGLIAPNATIGWGGGEPTLLSEFEDTCFWLFHSGYRQEFLTNGLIYSPAMEEVLREGRAWLSLSLDRGDLMVTRRPQSS